MFHCHACGNTISKPEFVSEVFEIDGRHVLVEMIPADVCTRCGEPVFSRKTTERIRLLVRSSTKPIKTEPLDVFALA